MSANELDQAAAGGLGLAFLLSEFRDMRKGMESRDENLRASIDGVREGLSILGAKVDNSQNDVAALRGKVEDIQAELTGVQGDMSALQRDRESERIRKESSWLGPQKIFRTVIYLGSVGTAIFVLLKFWPAASAFLAAL